MHKPLVEHRMWYFNSNGIFLVAIFRISKPCSKNSGFEELAQFGWQVCHCWVLQVRMMNTIQRFNPFNFVNRWVDSFENGNFLKEMRIFYSKFGNWTQKSKSLIRKPELSINIKFETRGQISMFSGKIIDRIFFTHNQIKIPQISLFIFRFLIFLVRFYHYKMIVNFDINWKPGGWWVSNRNSVLNIQIRA